MNDGKMLTTLKEELLAFLHEQSLDKLRSVGRYVGVERSTAKKKGELIEKIVAVEEGSLAPAPETKKGAPVKNDFVDPKIMERLEKFRYAALSGRTRAENKFPYADLHTENNLFEVCTPEREFDSDNDFTKAPSIGQLASYRGGYALFPLDGNVSDCGNELPMVLPVLTEKYDLREGDVLSCDVKERNKTKIVTDVFAINGVTSEKIRGKFADFVPAYPEKKIGLSTDKQADFATKLLDLIAPVGFGQRALVSADGRNGQKNFLDSVVYALRHRSDVRLVYLSVGESPEREREYKEALLAEQYVCSSFDKGAEHAVFAANFALERVKRCVESGQNAVLVVNSFNALARAYNATSLSLGGKTLSCGLESKTLQYLKGYFGSAHHFENRPSLTIIGGLTVEKGEEADELLRRELGEVANAYIKLKRIPYSEHDLADLSQTITEGRERLLSDEEKECLTLLYRRLLPTDGEEGVCKLLSSNLNLRETLAQIKEKSLR